MLKFSPESLGSLLMVSPKHRSREEAEGEEMMLMVLMVLMILSFMSGDSSSPGEGAGISSFEPLRKEIR